MVRILQVRPEAVDPKQALEQVAEIAGARLQQQISLAAPRDAALTWKAAAVHPLQAMETEYQGIVHDAVRGMDNPEQRKLAEGKALGQFYFFDAGAPRLLGVGQGEAYDGDPHPLINDKLRAIRHLLKDAEALLQPRGGAQVDVDKLRQVLRTAFDRARAVRAIFVSLPDSDQWQVPAIDAATHALGGLRHEIAQANTVPRFAEIIRHIEMARRNLTEAANGLGSVQMFYVIETFYLFRLLVRYQIESPRHLSDEAIAEASGALTDLMTNGHPWLNDWLRDKIVELADRIRRVDPANNTLFFLKGGRALRYLEGQPQRGKNDWDTQIVINPELPPADWYDLFRRVSNEVLMALQDFNAELYTLLHHHAARMQQELADLVQPPDPPPPNQAQLLDVVWDRIDLDALEDWLNEDELQDPLPRRHKANCKAELIDIGLPRYDTIEALEQWRHLRENIQIAPDLVPYPGPLYYIAEYLMMVREVFAGHSHSLRKAPVRIERLYNMLNLPGVDALVAAHHGAVVQARLPLSYDQVLRVQDIPSRRALLVTLADFIKAYGLDKDIGFNGAQGPVMGFAQAFDAVLAPLVPALPQEAPYPPGVADMLNTLNQQPGPLCLARAIGFAEQVSQWAEAHLKERAAFVLGRNAELNAFLQFFFTSHLVSPTEERELQAAIRGSYGAWLQGSYANSLRTADLDPTAFISIGVYSSNPHAAPPVLFELLQDAVQDCLQQARFAGRFERSDDPGAQVIRLFWNQADLTLTFQPVNGDARTADYAGLAIEFVVLPPPARPLLTYVWGLPVLGLRDLVGEYRAETADIEDYGCRSRLRRTTDALGEIATRAIDPAIHNPATAALRDGTGHHLMISSDSLAIGRGADYPQSYAASNMALKLVLTRNRAALRKALTLPPAAPSVDRSLDLLVINQGHGDLGRFAHWTAKDLRDNLVGPMVRSGVRANIIVLDFCLSASLIGCFAELCAPGGVILSHVYSTSDVLLTTEVWRQLEQSLKHRDVAGVRRILDQRATAMSEGLTGLAHVEAVRSWSELETAVYLQHNPFDADPISIIRYLPGIAHALQNPNLPPAVIAQRLAEIAQSRYLGYNDRAIVAILPATPEQVAHIITLFRNRLIMILIRLNLPNCDLQALPLFGAGGLWDMVIDHRLRLLAQARGLRRCPTPLTIFSRDDAKLLIDEAIAKPQIAPEVRALLSIAEPSAVGDIVAILDELFDEDAVSVLQEVPDLFQ